MMRLCQGVILKRHYHACHAMDSELEESDLFADAEEDEDQLEETSDYSREASDRVNAEMIFLF